MQACDTISLICGMDTNSMIMYEDDFVKACGVILRTQLSDLPEHMVKPIERVQRELAKFLQIGLGAHEDFNSSTGAKVLYV